MTQVISRTLDDVLLEIGKASVEELLLVVVDLAELVNLLDPIGTELDAGGEEIDAVILEERTVDKGRFDDARLTLGGLQQAFGETSTGHGHG